MFSKTELKVLKTIGQKKMKIGEITHQIYGNLQPLNAQNSIAGTIRRINDKAAYNDLDWILAGVGVGRNGRTVWKEKL